MAAVLGPEGEVLMDALSDPVAVVEQGSDGRIVVVRANPAMARALLQPLEALPGAEVEQLFRADGDSDVPGRIRRAFDEQLEVGYEAVRERPQGRHVYLGTVVPPSSNEALLIERDISEEHRTARKLEELEALTETGTWSWNLADGAIEWSPELRRIVGVGAAFRAHIDVAYAFVHPDDRDRVQAALTEVRDHGRTEEFQYRVVRPSGEHRAVCGRASRAVDGDGQPVRIFGTIQDVTTRMALEAGEAARQRLVRQQDRALQLNDDVIQSLARAWLALDLERPDEVRLAVTEGMETVRRMMAELLQATGALQGGTGRGLRPGELAHLRAARSDRGGIDGLVDADERPT